MRLGTDQQIALRLLESLIVLVPVWIAVCKYIIEDKGEMSKKNIFGGYFLATSYMLLVLALVGLRAVLIPAVETAILGISIDLIILFVLIATAGLLLAYFDQAPGPFTKTSFRHGGMAFTIVLLSLIVILGWVFLGLLGHILEIIAKNWTLY